ncbi:MAG: GNAT family N-acetyltransferase [Cetobacterium sp.]|uniref:GNAT family N-acetyltransferase n=1 Tax=Cetobacterium sp. TaxID=2071632 RepID=UPI002FC5D722
MHDVMIETERLILRKIKKDDYLEIANILQDIDVMYAWEKSFSDDEVKLWINKNLKRYDNEGYSYFLAISKENDTVIGVIGPLVEEINNKSFIGIAYILNKKSWGKGYAVEGARACIEYAFNNLNSLKVIAQIRPNNINSINVAQKLNMKIIDKYIKIYDGKEMEHLIYSIDAPQI